MKSVEQLLQSDNRIFAAQPPQHHKDLQKGQTTQKHNRSKPSTAVTNLAEVNKHIDGESDKEKKNKRKKGGKRSERKTETRNRLRLLDAEDSHPAHLE